MSNDRWKQVMIPDRTSLVKRPTNFDGRTTRGEAGDLLVRVAVVKYSSGINKNRRETVWSNNVVILRSLVSCEEDRVALSNMNIKGGINLLHCVCTLYFHQCHFMILDSEVEWMFQSNIAYPQSISFPCKRFSLLDHQRKLSVKNINSLPWASKLPKFKCLQLFYLAQPWTKHHYGLDHW